MASAQHIDSDVSTASIGGVVVFMKVTRGTLHVTGFCYVASIMDYLVRGIGTGQQWVIHLEAL